MRHALTLAAVLALVSASPSVAEGPADLTVDVDFNAFTEATNHWEATGAFQDQGTIKHDHSEEFRGSTAYVIDSPQGANGSFTWTFHRSFSPDPAFPGLLKSSGGWRMLGGTGAYEGITGEGIVTGSFNTITGQIHDHFVGKVKLP